MSKKESFKKAIGISLFLVGIICLSYMLIKKNSDKNKIETAIKNTYAPQN